MTGTLAIFVGVSPKYGSLSTSGVERPQQRPGARPLDRQHRPVVAHLLDADVEPADQPLEVGEVRLGGREEELLGPVAQDDAVLDDEAAVVAPRRVLRVARLRTSRMSRTRTPARNRSASGPVIRYLYSGDESNRPALLRIAKYSNFSDIW